MPTLRTGIPEDFDALYPIYMHESINRFLSFEDMPKEQFRPIFNELFRDSQLYIYEADDQQIIATCIVTRLKRRANHVATIGTLATHPAFQGKGIGKQFMLAVIDELKKSGIKRIDLCAEADNPIAIAFYKKLGFQLEGVLKKYFLRANENKYVDEYLMALIFE